jgi:hypothetical protein
MPRSVIGIGLLALAARAALVAFESGLTYDGTYYLRQAARLASGDYQWVGFPPGYPLAILAMQAAVRDAELAARVVSLVTGVATVVVFHIGTRRALGGRLAALASLVLALHPELVRASSVVLSESLYVFLVLVAVVSCERHAWAASLALGLAFLCRPEALLLLGVLPAALWLRDRKRPVGAWLIGFVFVAAYSVMVSRAIGHFVISPKLGQLDVDGDVLTRLWVTLRSTHAVFPLILLPGAVWIGARRRLEWLVPCAYVPLLALYDIHVQQRMLLPALPFLVALSAVWLSHLASTPRRVALIGSGVLLILGLAPALKTFGTGAVLTPRAREIGTALQPHLRFNDRVAGRFPFVSYYAGAGFVRLPLAAYDVAVDSIAAMGATHLLVLENEVTNITPQLRPLFEDAVFTAAEGRLHAVAWVDEPPGNRAILYQMREPDLSVSRAPVVRSGAQGVAWLGDDLVVASRAGLDLLPVPPGSPAPDVSRAQRLVPGSVRDPAASADGRRLAFVRVEEPHTMLAVYDAATGEFVSFDSTGPHEPVSPTFVDSFVLYVRTTPPRGLQLLQLRTGVVRDVTLKGLEGAAATPLAVTARDHDVAITYVRAPATGRRRVIATATWPATLPGSGAIELPGLWASELSLTNDHVAWLPGDRRVLASIAIGLLDDEGNVTRYMTSIAVVYSSALYRRLSFDFDNVRRPARRDTRIAFLSGDGDVRATWLDPDNARIPRVRVYESVVSEP